MVENAVQRVIGLIRVLMDALEWRPTSNKL